MVRGVPRAPRGHASQPGRVDPAEFGAWSGAEGLGTLGNLVVLAVAIFAIVAAALGGRGIELDGSGSRLLTASLAATAVVVLRMAFPPTSLSGYEFDADLRLGIFVTLAGTLTLVWGSWRRRSHGLGAGATSASARSPSAGSRWSPHRSA